jgi:hypothetical protein
MSDYELRKRIFDEIKKFNRTEQEELYRILRRCTEDLSETKNGMFFDVNNLKPETIKEIQKYITFWSKNKISFEIREKEMTELQTTNPGITEGK